MKAYRTKGLDSVMCTSHRERVIDFECLDHNYKMCSLCAALFHRKCKHVDFLGKAESSIVTTNASGENIDMGLKTGRTDIAARSIQTTDKSERFQNEEIKNETDVTAKRRHRLVSRLSKDASLDEREDGESKSQNDLEQDFSLAKPINENENQFSADTTSRRPLARLFWKNLEEISQVIVNPSEEISTKVSNSNECWKPVTKPSRNRADSNNISNTSITGSGSLNDILEEDEDVVHVSVDQSVPKSQVTLVSEFYIRTQSDPKCCSVTGICCLAGGQFLLVDEANMNVKLFDKNGVYKSHLDLTDEPWDVTGIEQFEAAVSCPGSRSIHIIHVQDQLTISKTFELDKRCYGLAYHKCEIYVAMNNEVRIINCEGKTINRISHDLTKKKIFSVQIPIPKPLFRSARYVSVKSLNGETLILVSDSGKSCVTYINRRGQVITRLKLGGEGEPRDISMGTSEEFYVCQAPNKLIAISSDEHGNRIKPLLELDAIQAVQYHAESKRLWVLRKVHNFVFVYSLNNEY